MENDVKDFLRLHACNKDGVFKTDGTKYFGKLKYLAARGVWVPANNIYGKNQPIYFHLLDESEKFLNAE